MLRVLIPSCNPNNLQRCMVSMDRSQPNSSHRVMTVDLQPFVYSQAINYLASCCPEDDILIMGDDTEIDRPDWLYGCEYLFRYWPESIGILNIDEGLHRSKISETTFAFVGSLIPRWIWDEIGPMDERFTGYAWDDTDYCVRVLHAGYQLALTTQAQIKHKGSGTYNQKYTPEQLAQMSAHNQRLFCEKWGLPMPDVPSNYFLPAEPHLNRKGCQCASISA